MYVTVNILLLRGFTRPSVYSPLLEESEYLLQPASGKEKAFQPKFLQHDFFQTPIV